MNNIKYGIIGTYIVGISILLYEDYLMYHYKKPNVSYKDDIIRYCMYTLLLIVMMSTSNFLNKYL